MRRRGGFSRLAGIPPPDEGKASVQRGRGRIRCAEKRPLRERLNSYSQERKEKIAAENERIRKLQTAEEIIEALRKEREILCRDTIVQRALDMEDALLPLLLKRYQTNSMDSFLEVAAQIIARADRKYSEMLFADYHLIRAAYARAQACLVFAAQKMTKAIPLLVQEVERLGQVKDREYKSDLSQAPLLALYVLNGQPY